MAPSTHPILHLDAELLARLAGVRDDIGVLTVLVEPSPVGAAEVRASLQWLEGDLPLSASQGAVDAMLGARLVPACGLVAALSGGEILEFMLAAPIPTLVEVADTARMLPIARSFDASRPVGVVDIHRNRARIVEAGPEPFEVAHVPLLPARRSDWTEFKAPAAANPLRAYRSSPQRERYEHRVDANRARTLHDLSDSVERIAHTRGWRSLVIAGDPELTREVEPRGIPSTRVDRPLPEWKSTADVVRDMRDELDVARELGVAALAHAARSRSRGFARGLAATREALDDGRARTVALEGSLDDPGAAEVVRRALARGLPVLFAHGELAGLHGAICELHG